MKSGVLTQAIDKPVEGFTIEKDGCGTHIQYIENINTIKIVNNDIDDKKETTTDAFEYVLYETTVIISTYEDLIKAMIALKYDIEDEIALMNNFMADPNNREEYDTYRYYVGNCKDVAKDKYEELGLIKL